jgi:protein PhnA
LSTNDDKTIADQLHFHTTQTPIYLIQLSMNRHDEEETNPIDVTDSQGNVLENGDAAFITQDLPVKGMKPIKRGAILKNIRVNEGPEAVGGKIDGVSMVILTCYLKKKK